MSSSAYIRVIVTGKKIAVFVKCSEVGHSDHVRKTLRHHRGLDFPNLEKQIRQSVLSLYRACIVCEAGDKANS